MILFKDNFFIATCYNLFKKVIIALLIALDFWVRFHPLDFN